MDPIHFGNDVGLTMQPVSQTTAITPTDRRETLPVLEGRHVTLRALRVSDAPSLLTLLTTPEVARFIAPPPTTVEGFEQFIARTNQPSSARKHLCFAVTLNGNDTAIGIFQIRELEPGFRTAEWGFALGSPFWGTGVFGEGAKLVLEFAFETLGVHRMEARAAVRNGRGGRALLKLGAVQEGVLRKAFLRNGQYLDQFLYAILEDDQRAGFHRRQPAISRPAMARSISH